MERDCVNVETCVVTGTHGIGVVVFQDGADLNKPLGHIIAVNSMDNRNPSGLWHLVTKITRPSAAWLGDGAASGRPPLAGRRPVARRAATGRPRGPPASGFSPAARRPPAGTLADLGYI